jgi:hypothetical protein
MFLDVVANVLGNIDSRFLLICFPTSELGHLLGNTDLLKEPRVAVILTIGMRTFLHDSTGLRP